MDLPYPITPADFDDIVSVLRANCTPDRQVLVDRIREFQVAAIEEAKALDHTIVELRNGGRGESNFVWRCTCGATCGVATLNRAFAEKSANDHLKEAVQQDADRIMWEELG